MLLDTYQNFFSNFTFGCLFLSMIFHLINLGFPKFTIICSLGKLASILANITLFETKKNYIQIKYININKEIY